MVGRACALAASGSGMLVSGGASEKRRSRCRFTLCAQEGALDVEEEERERRRRRGEGKEEEEGCIMVYRLDRLYAGQTHQQLDSRG